VLRTMSTREAFAYHSGVGVLEHGRPPRRREQDVLARREQVADVLGLVVVVRRDLVARADLPREPQRVVPDALIVDAGAAVGIEAVGDDVVVADAAMRAEEPQLVPFDRSAERRVHIEDLVDRIGRSQAAVDQILRQVVALERMAGVADVGRAAQRVAAFARHQVQVRSAGRDFGAERGGLHRDFLAHRVVVIGMAVAAADERVHLHAVDIDGRVLGDAHVRGEARVDGRSRAADILVADLGAHGERAFGLIHARHRDGVEQLPRENRRPLRVLHVDDRRLARDGHRLLDRADAQLGVDGRREVRRQLDAILHERAESWDRERHLVQPGTQVDDGVASLRIGRDGADLFNERGARRLHDDARKDAAARILHEAGDGALGGRCPGKQDEGEGCCHGRLRESPAKHKSLQR